MNRKIKFRAWIKEEKQTLEIDRIDFGLGWVWCELPNGDYDEYDFDQIELMQFTGLHDKNGKEIYEGDMVKKLKERGVVYFEDGCFYVKFQNRRYRVAGFDKEVIEIIGNIYENEELLT